MEGVGRIQVWRLCQVSRCDDDVEPVFFWDSDPRFYDSMINDYFVKTVIDLSPGAGTLALTCIRRRVGYLGICMSDAHREGLRGVLVDGILSAMQEEGSGLYQPRLVQAMSGQTPDPAAKAKAKAKAKGSAGQGSGGGPEAKKRGRAKAKAAPVADGGGGADAGADGGADEGAEAELSDFSFSDLEGGDNDGGADDE